jgi:siderophore synthetase component
VRREGSLEIMTELGWRGVCLDGDTPDPRLSVLFRRMPRARSKREPMVLAALLTPAPGDGEPPLADLLRQAGIDAEHWFGRYLDVALIPLLELFARTGVSLEAHTQNALLGVRHGWPERLCARDMEGTSLACDAGAVRACLGRQLAEGSPALYSSGEAWRRFLYYVVTNQTGDVVATLARHGGVGEDALWRVARDRVAALRRTLRGAWGAQYPDDLLERPTLPAKANFLSSLAGRGETPLYVEIPNPLR